MDPEAKKALQRRKQLAKFRFKCLCRKVIVNAYWLSAIEDTTLGSNPRRNINIIVRRSGKKGILTLKEKSIFNKPNEDRTVEEKEQLRAIVNSLKCFEMIPSNIRDNLVEVCHFLYCAPQKVILREGHHPSALYFILDGEINVSKRLYSIEEGKIVDNVQYALVPGDFFGIDGFIFGNRRAVTCTTAIHTELLYIFEKDLSDELRKSLLNLCEDVRASLQRFDYYFGHFTEQQIIECCTFSKIRQYELDSVVYDEDETKQKTAFFLLSGQCSILQYLKMKVCGVKCKIIDKKKHFTLVEDERNDTTDKLEQKFSNAAMESTNSLELKAVPQVISADVQNEVEEVFVNIATLSCGSMFGLGEQITNRSIVAKNTVQCLEIPRYWLLQRSQNIGNIWQRTKYFYNATIPSRELLFDDFVRSSEWNQYKDRTVTQLLHLKSKL